MYDCFVACPSITVNISSSNSFVRGPSFHQLDVIRAISIYSLRLKISVIRVSQI